MIKANELRVGNWVANKNGLPYKITGFNIAHIEGTENNMSNFNTAAYPITITPEILEKCGFFNDTSLNIYIILKEENFISYKFEDDVFVPFDDFYHGFMPNIKYIHQLQNLYFALSGKELQVNL